MASGCVFLSFLLRKLRIATDGDRLMKGSFVASFTSGGLVHSFRREFGSLEDRRGEPPR